MLFGIQVVDADQQKVHVLVFFTKENYLKYRNEIEEKIGTVDYILKDVDINHNILWDAKIPTEKGILEEDIMCLHTMSIEKCKEELL